MNIQENQIIGELVAQDYRTAAVFKKYGIDFCCQGNRTIHDACEQKHMDGKSVISDLNALLRSYSDNAMDYQTWSLDVLADYIEKKHHRYVEEKSLEIQPYLEKICRVHGDRHPELHDIREHFIDSVVELTSHMRKEELVLFPYIRKMEKAKRENSELETPHFGTVQHPIQMMMNEHSTEGDRFRRIEELSNRYTPPPDACNTYRVTFALLKEFEQDLHLHIHLENNILFRKALELEGQLN